MFKKKQIKCPGCGECFEAEDDLVIGDVTYCVDCDQELKIVSLNPLQVKKIIDYPEVCDGGYKNFYHSHYADDNDEEEEEEPRYSDSYEESNDQVYQED
ncbi:MAG: hypothetical protein ABIG64_03785 [Candidatus Omnitrophota bacterium]